MSKKKKKKKKGSSEKSSAMQKWLDSGGGGFRNYLKVPEGTEFFKPEKKKTYVLDILPYNVSDKKHPDKVKKGMTWFKRTLYLLRNVGPEEETMLSPRTLGKKCPVSEEYNRLRNDSDSSAKEMAKGLKAKVVEVYNIRLKGSKKVMLFEMSRFCFGDVLAEAIEMADDPALRDFYEADGGVSLKIKFKEDKYEGRAFLKLFSVEFIERDKPIGSSILKKVIDLDKILVVPEYDDLKDLFFGEERDEEEDGADDDDVEETEEDEDDDEDEDDEDSSDDDDEDEDEDESDEDEEDDDEDDDDDDSDDSDDEESDDDEDDDEDEDEDVDEEEEDEDEDEEEEKPKKKSKKKSKKRKKK